ncbi:MAG: fibronectin type III domain-containing protein, partial [Bacteroidales bacterium]|nr:fibronectin type III domain-containing protein [Bacteroidales bacterium]
DIENSTSFHLLSVVPTTDTLATYKYELNAYVIPTSAQLAFRWYNTDSCAHCKIDDILMDSLELCLTPTVSNIAVLSDTSVAISLTAGWNESHWLAEYGVTGFVRGTGDSVEIFSNNFVINGLTPSTKYDFYVQSLCDSVNSSNWSIVKRFTTPCEATTIPYYENFESYPATNYGVVGVIPTCWNLISGASNANYYSRISTYYAPYGNGLLMTSSSVTYGKNNYVVLPWFSSNLNGLKISFASKMDNATLGTLSLGYVTNIDADNSFVELQRFSNSTAIVPHNFSFENSVIPDGARIAFRWNFNMSLSMNCNIDNIAVEFIPCEPVDSVEVSNIMMTTADLSWKPGDDEPAWKVEYGVTGFTPGAGDTVLTVDTNYITLTNLIGNRTYDVYVRAACEEANQSPNSQAVTFTPYCITFADTVFESACDHFQWLDTTFTQSGIYVDTLYQAATYSCDSVVTLNLTIYPIYSQFDTLVICQNDLPYTWRDTVFEVGTDSNDFTFYRTTMNGCDSVVHLNLSVNPSYYPIENETICQNDLPYTWRDTIFEAGTQTGSYILFRHTENGCDSIVTLQLIVNPSYYQTEIEHICQNDLPYTWRDTTLQVGTISAVHTFYRHSQLGCDSIVTFVLMVKPAVDEIVTENICRSELPYTWRDTIFAEGTISGEYHFFRHARNSCDSTITLHLTVNESATENVVENICNTDLPYTWRDTTFEVGTVTGSYRFARQTTKGCDSLVTLSLNVNSAFYQDTTAVICQSELPFIFKDTVFYENTTSGIYRLPRQTAAGCDSVYTLNLTINPTYTDQLNFSICQNELPYTWRDTTFDVNTLTGDYSFIKSSIADCDSITTLHLTIYESYNETISLSVCENELPIAWRGNVIPHGTTTGVYTYNETSIHGCDSTVVLNLTVDPTYRQSENLTICRNDLPYMWRDTIFQVGSHSGTFLFETQSHTGCDSTVILKLTINDNYDFAETVTVCKSELPYTWRDTTFMNGTISDTYTFYRQSVNGCDSVVTLHLTVNETYYQTENAAICENDLPYTWRDTIFGIGTIDGDYHFARTTRNGCDSMVTLTLTVLPAYHSQITLDICQNELPYEWNDTVFGVGTPSGAYTFNHPSVAGCDSLLTLQLNVYPTYQQTEAMVICENELPYIWRDTTFQRGTSSGVYYFQNLSENGCDSLVTLALIVNPSYELEEETVICDNGFPFQWRDTVFEIGTTTNDYIFTRQSIKGCDSIVTLHLTVHPTYHQNVGLVICQNDLPYTWRDTTFEVGTHSRNFLFYKESQEGCDSIVTLTLTVNPSYEQVFNVEICENDFPYSWQDTTFLSGTESGTYIFHYTSISNCDSNIILNLTIHPSYRIDADLT